MFEATIEKAVILKKIIDALKELVLDAKFECTASGISLQAMDSAHVSLVALILRADGFEKYRCDRSVTLGLNLDSFSRVLKAAGNDDSVTIRAEEDADTVCFTFDSKNKTTNFELKLLQMDVDSLGLPDTEYESVVKLPAVDFQKICANLGSWGDSVLISTSKKAIKFSVVGDLANGEVVMKQNSSSDDPDSGTTIILHSEVSLTFALQKLSAFTKATPLSSTVTLSLSANLPLSVEYVIQDLGFIRYYLAPKIEDDNE
eukprot:TRINITY_DN1160_c0_g1_i2.p1 TRINITY_DN1160_c0_g1~~TRINITY_DN1160_c0_g1_i2.p1  ORF type:complete len:259 (-),score=39.06 TRINITY_DN1160_c0_g1_i2:217-993(-)